MTFDFITDISIPDEHQYLSDLFSRVKDVMTVEEEVQENVFRHAYIPRTLQELSPEEIEKQKHEDKLYAKLTGL